MRLSLVLFLLLASGDRLTTPAVASGPPLLLAAPWLAEGGESPTSNELIVKPGQLLLQDGKSERVLLRLEDLPEHSRIAEGMELGRERFSRAVWSPDQRYVAFAVEGFHGWCGLYRLMSGEAQEVAFFFDGRATYLTFSPDSSLLAVEGVGGSSFPILFLWDVQQSRAIPWELPRAKTDFPPDLQIGAWRGSALEIRLRWAGSEEWQPWRLEVKNGLAKLRKVD